MSIKHESSLGEASPELAFALVTTWVSVFKTLKDSGLAPEFWGDDVEVSQAYMVYMTPDGGCKIVPEKVPSGVVLIDANYDVSSNVSEQRNAIESRVFEGGNYRKLKFDGDVAVIDTE